jgi:AraC-like DNA-binding protein
MGAPWGFRVGSRPSPAFHLLTSGAAWLEVDGIDELLWLQAGDLVILPRGPAHQLRDARDSRILWLDDILTSTPVANGRLRHGGAGPRTELVCGGFAVDQLPVRALFDTLPEIVHLRGRDGRAPEWLSSLIRMISLEIAVNGPGTMAVVNRLSEALLAQALRSPLLEAEELGSPLQDVSVARALRLIREQPGAHWTVPTLATAVGLSRSAFARRFKTATGQTPMESLTSYRLARAAVYLTSSDAGLSEIAERIGYESEASISKAFRRQYGASPGAYRKALRGSKAVSRLQWPAEDTSTSPLARRH